MVRVSFKHSIVAVAGLAALAATGPALAHPGIHHAVLSVASGFAHPFSGVDHILAFAAIGLWTAQYRDRKAWLLPLLFLIMMTFGALAGVAGARVPGIEGGIAISVAVLGLLVAFAVRMPLALASALVSCFALLHGFAHGVALPHRMSAVSYVAGFVMATGLLHLAGFAAGAIAGRTAKANAARLAGAGIAVTGMYLLAAVV